MARIGGQEWLSADTKVATVRHVKTAFAATIAKSTVPTKVTSPTRAGAATPAAKRQGPSHNQRQVSDAPGRTVLGLAEIVLWTRHMEQTFNFYSTIFGLELISPPEFRTRFLSAGAGEAGIPGMIVLFPHPETEQPFPPEKPRRVLHHLALAVGADRYDTLQARCREAGLQTREGIHPVLKDVRTFYVDDPEGNEVEVIARASEDKEAQLGGG